MDVYGIEDEVSDQSHTERKRTTQNRTNRPGITSAQLKLVALILVLGIAGTFLQLLREAGLQQSAMLYIGLPVFIAIMITVAFQPESAMGITMMAITLGVLLSGIVFQEGIICMVIAAPIFYAVAALVIWPIQAYARRNQPDVDQATKLQAQILLAIPLLIMSLEGTHPYLSFERSQSVQVERVVPLSPEALRVALARPMNFDATLPPFLRLGFPTPVGESIQGNRMAVGSERVVSFEMQSKEGGMVHLRVIEQGENHLRFAVLQNTTATADWLALHETVVEWRSTGPNETLVTWTFHYDRLLDPAWYFGPLERYGVEQAATYLIDALAV